MIIMGLLALVLRLPAAPPSRSLRRLTLALAVFCSMPSPATVLAPDRADALYHSFDGGGVEITGPSLLFRKNIKDKVGVRANYYVDMISSASVDVLATASPYTEERTQIGVGLDYLHNKTLMSLDYINSEEDDYSGQTAMFSVSQDFFGDLSTFSMSYAIGDDEVRNNADPNFAEPVDRRNFAIGLSQILTKSWVMELSLETIVEQGYLNNPYRSVRYFDADSALGYSYQPEIYPNTRNSDAASLRTIYYLPYRAAVRGEYRYFSDSWGVNAHNFELRYVQPLAHGVTLEGKYRYYTQNAADFYADIFPFADSQNFMGRDKELSTFSSNTLGAGITWEFPLGGVRVLNTGTLNLYWDFMQFDYQDFRDVLAGGPPGHEPLYSFNANVIRFFVSFWF
jgi:hypothetical protein